MQSEFNRSCKMGTVHKKFTKWFERIFFVTYISANINKTDRHSNAIGKFLVLKMHSIGVLNDKYLQFRLYSNPARRPSFLSQFVENIKQEMRKNKEMKESLKKFREEAQKLEQSDALRTARQKFQAVESEANKSSEVIKEKLDTLKEKVYIIQSS